MKGVERMSGAEIKKTILAAGLKIWQVAKAYGVADTTFSKYLRRDFTADETEKVLNIISELKKA